jgi:phage tail-like protein
MGIRVLGGQRELQAKHLFLVEIEGIGDAAFQKCSELSMENQEILYPEGGSSIPWKMPGHVTVTDITLERGTSSSREFYDWAQLVNAAGVGANTGGTGVPTRGAGVVLSETGSWAYDGSIHQLDRDGETILKTWDISQAWPKKFVAADGWDATVDEVVMEQLVLAMDFFELAT